MTLKRPEAHESNDYFKRYINQVESDDALKVLHDLKSDTLTFLKNLTAEKWNYRYAEGKWSIKEVFLHLIDTERIFAYRALRVSRNDKTPLPGFEQDDYLPYNYPEQRSPESIIEEYAAVRDATITLFKSLNDEALGFLGTASNGPISPRAILFITAGHEIHHMKIIEERYL